MTPTIEAAGLTKRFGKTRALDGLDLVAEPGQVVAVLGPNGAGKTTFVRAVATLLRPDRGSLHVAGHDVGREPEAVRRRDRSGQHDRAEQPAAHPRPAPVAAVHGLPHPLSYAWKILPHRMMPQPQHPYTACVEAARSLTIAGAP